MQFFHPPNSLLPLFLDDVGKKDCKKVLKIHQPNRIKSIETKAIESEHFVLSPNV